jgi:hypothetical protein
MAGPNKRNQSSPNKENDNGKERADNGKTNSDDNSNVPIVAVYIPSTKKTKIVSSTEEATHLIMEMKGLIESESKTFASKEEYEDFLRKVNDTDKNQKP